MLVKDLIAMLESCPQDKEVKLSIYDSATEHRTYNIAQVRDNPESTTVFLRNYNIASLKL